MTTFTTIPEICLLCLFTKKTGYSLTHDCKDYMGYEK